MDTETPALATEWAVTHRFDGLTLRRADPVPILMRSMSDFQDFGSHQGRIHTVLAELFSNAFDHGLLRLDSTIKKDADGFTEYYLLRQERLSALDPSAKIAIELTHQPLESDSTQGRLQIVVRDSGQSFDFENL